MLCYLLLAMYCIAAIPHIAELTKQYPNVYIISISREDPEMVTKLMNGMAKMKEHNIGAEPTGALNSYMDSQNCEGIPHAFIFNC